MFYCRDHVYKVINALPKETKKSQIKHCGRRDPAYPGTSLRILRSILDLSM